MKKIVLTGGPCGGKTKIFNRLKKEFADSIVFVPEVATMLMEGGYPRDGSSPSEEWLNKFQTVVLKNQLRVEAEALEEAGKRGLSVIICDRGALDGSAYVPGGEEVFCALTGTDAKELASRYDLVLHLESRAIGDPDSYGNNTNSHRLEGPEAAIAIDDAIWKAWKHHPNHIRVHFEGSIDDKYEKVSKVIEDFTKLGD